MAVSWSIGTKVPAGSRSGLAQAADALQPGQRFGPYRVIAPLGIGSSSRVYRADGPAGECALKVLKSALPQEARQRFRREGTMAAGLDHPGMVRLLDGGEIEDVPFLAYELVGGRQPLAARLEQADLRRRVTLLAGLASAIGAAHAQGVVHRDLKPANVLVDERGELRVTDFGLGFTSDLARLTQTGAVVGTPRYMSPEQLNGDRNVGPGVDVWGAGVLLYMALTGQHPFVAKTLLELRVAVHASPPTRPSRLNTALPEALETVVLRALALDPAARYPDGAALARALKQVAPDVPSIPGPRLPRADPRPASSTVGLPFALGRHGRFELLDVLGRGGMGVVYRARDRDLEREIALKFVLGEGGARRAKRFQREGEITAALVHENVLRVHATGVLKTLPYLVYELVPGARPLDEVAKEQDLRGKLRLLRDASRGLGYAHEQGVVHRDVKPENVLVGNDGRVRVADFGLAALQGLERLTRTGAMVGTPRFMAPELIAGDRSAVGPATDVWALGVILFHQLCGRFPFEGERLVEVVAAITSAVDAPSPRAVLPSLDPALDAICRCALQPEPGRRYETATAMAQDLEAYLTGKAPTASRGNGVWPAVLRRSRAPALLALPVIGAALILALAWRPDPSATSPQASSTASPTASPTESENAGAPVDPREEWESIRGLDDPRDQVAAALAWRREHAGHELTAAADRFLNERRYAYRVADFPHDLRPGAKTLATFTHDGSQVLTLAADRQLVRWSLLGRRDGGHQLLLVPKHPTGRGAKVHDVARWGDDLVFAGGGSTPLLLGADGESRLDESFFPSCVATSADRRHLFYGTHTGEVRWLSREPGEERERTLPATDWPVDMLQPSPAGHYLFVGAHGEEPNDRVSSTQELLIRLADGRIVRDAVPAGKPRSAAFFANETRLLVGYSGGQVALFDCERGTVVKASALDGRGERGDDAVLRAAWAHRGSVKALVVSQDERRLYSFGRIAAGRRKGDLRVWDLETLQELRSPVSLRAEPERVEASSDGRLLLISTQGGGSELWAVDLVEVE